MINNPQNYNLIFHKIQFLIRKKVNYGQAIYVCGNVAEIGLWDPPKAYRLKWNQGDIWSGCILFNNHTPETIEYKYIISDWNDVNDKNSEWQIGLHNRKVQLVLSKSMIICDDRWNMDKITMNLLVPKNKLNSENKYYILGDIVQLGNWQQKKQMKKIIKKNIFNNKKQNIILGDINIQQDIYTYTFYTYRLKQQFIYYYIKKTNVIEYQRKPGRVFKFNNQNIKQKNRIKVTHPKGQISITDYLNINQIIFSQITSQIFVGSYPKSHNHIHTLKSHSISAILSIQSEKDYKKHGLSPHYLSLLCQENGIKYKKYSILDMNNDDFINKAGGGLKMLSDLIKQGENVYVHCTAGIYRSPQMIALYLTLFQKYQIQQAVKKIKASHPLAKPSCKVIKDAIGLINLCKNQRYAIY